LFEQLLKEDASMPTIVLSSVIQRRLLVNYRVDPVYAARILPSGFRPQLVRGWAVAGICLLRLGRVRPTALPGRAWGLTSENAAHRYAVEWDTPSGPTTGVFIGRRDSGSRLNVLAGGRVFPGQHGQARFGVSESDSGLHVRYATVDRSVWVDVAGTIPAAPWWQGSELFDAFSDASEFFRRGHDGYSPGRKSGFEGMRLRCDQWQARPVAIERAVSSVYDAYPAGAATLDCALVITDVPAQWEPLPLLPAS
jgi:Uncharacterized conserved protein (COG2071)